MLSGENKSSPFQAGEQYYSIYTDRNEQFGMLVLFLQEGLQKKEKCLFIIAGPAAGQARKSFWSHGLDLQPFLESGAFSFLSREEACRREGRFDPKHVINMLSSSLQEALQDGYSGLRVVMEMAWISTRFAGTDCLLEFEAGLKQIQPDSRLTVICQYDTQRSKPERLLDVLRTQPRIILDGTCCENPLQENLELIPADLEGNLAGKMYENTVVMLKHHQEMESALREKQEQYTNLLSYLREGVILQKNTGEITVFNESAADILGLSAVEVLGKTRTDLLMIREDGSAFPPELHPSAVTLQTGKPCRDVVMGFKRKSGAVTWINVNTNPIFDTATEKPAAALVSFADITARKQLERALREERQMLEQILSIAAAGINITAANYSLRYVDPAWKKVHGEPAGRKCYEYFMGLNEPCTTCGITTALQTKKRTVREQTLAKEGNRIVEVHTIPFQDVTGEWLVVEFNVDITARKQAEQALRDALKQLDDIIEYSPEAIIVIDSGGRVIAWNKAIAEMTGVSKEDMLGKGDYEYALPFYGKRQPILVDLALLPPEEQSAMLKHNYDFASSKEGTLSGEVYCPETYGGQGAYLYASASQLRDASGNVIGAIETIRDISDRKQTEEAYRESEKKYREILSTMEEGYYEVDLAGNFVFFNDSLCQLLGYQRKELILTSYKKFYECPDEVFQTYNRVYRTGQPEKSADWPVITGDGRRIVIEVSISLRLDEDNEPIGFRGVAKDITARKLAAEKIAAYSRELEELNRQLDEEMDKARQVHERTLPTALPGDRVYNLAAHYQPAQKLGGDFFDVINTGKKLVFYLSDVSGHGLDGAMLSIFIKHTLKSYISTTPQEALRPAEILRHLAEQYSRENYPETFFICIFLAVLDLESRELTYTGAGFQDRPLVQLGNGEKLTLSSRGLFITSYLPVEMLALQERSLLLPEGSIIFFNTDGLTEQRGSGEYYLNRLAGIFYAHAHLPPQLLARVVCEDFKRFNHGSLQGDDDISFLILQIEPANKEKYRLELASDFRELARLQNEVSEIVSSHGHTSSLLTCLLTSCLYELTANAMEHGNSLDPGKKVQVELTVTDDYFLAQVTDQGQGFDWRKKLDKPLDLEGTHERGRGIAMTGICSDWLLYNEEGNQATLLLRTRRANA